MARVTERPTEPAPTAPSLPRFKTFASFRHHNYRLWFMGMIVSVIGTWMQVIAQGWLVYQLSGSELVLGLVSFASAIPVLLVSPWGGVIADVMPRRNLLVITQATSMVLALILAGLTFAGVVAVWHIVVLAMVLGVVNALDAPARQAFVVELVDREDMTNAIALNSMTFNGARVIGPAVGGVLLSWLGPAWCFLINGLSFLAVIATLLLMRLPARVTPRRVERPWGQFMEGVQYARSRRGIVGLLALATSFAIFGLAFQSLLPAFVDKNLHADAAVYGALNTCVGLGAVTGALIVARFGSSGVRGKLVTGASLSFPVLLAFFAYTQNVPTAALLAYALGLGFMLQANNQNSLLQAQVDDAMRGRVMSLYTLTFFGLSPFGALAAGAVAESIPLNLTIAITAAALFFLSALIHIRVPEIRRLK